MAENLKWIINNNPNAKTFVWAHNGHVKRNTYTMGEYLLELFDINPYIIGLTTSQGSYTAISNGVITNNPLDLPEKDCYEYYLNQNEQTNFFIDLQNAKDDFTFVSQPLKLREIGSMKRDVQFYDANILKEYDAIIFIKKTNSSECFFK
jgi:erythromycin esterase-like protein